MLAALKAKKDQAQAFVAEKKDEHETKKRSELLSKVEKDGEFKDFAGWQAEFEPVKPAGAKKASEPNVVQRKAMEKLTANITADVLKGLTETVSKLLGPAAQVVRGQEPELGRFLNAANAVALTYRFGYKDMKRFAYVRTVSADRIAQALGAAIEKEQQRSGHKELDPAAVKQAVDAITARCLDVLRTKEAEAVEALKASPLFGVTGASGEQLDAGVVLLKDFLRGYVQDQIGQVIRLLAGVLERLLHLAAKYKDAIKKHAAENKDGFADGSPEMQKLRDEILGEIEKSYQQLHDAVSKYVGGLVGLMNASGGDDEAGDA